MPEEPRVAHPPSMPHLFYDGDCHFCTFWVRRWQGTAGAGIVFVPFQDEQARGRFPEIPPERFERSVQLVDTDGAVFSGAEAVFRVLALNSRRQWLLRTYRTLPAFAWLSECGYSVVARNRSVFSWLTRLGWGAPFRPPDYALTRGLFLRVVGLVYLIAFLSLWVQVEGLVGSHGILPATDWMTYQHIRLSDVGWFSRLMRVPTLCWWDAGDGFLNGLCVAGAVLSILLVAGVAPVPVLIGLWGLYLSLSVVGQEFLSFQWDTLLLESGFLAILFAPRTWTLGRARASPPSALSIWLLRWLLFRLMFQSGLTKLIYDDPTWLDLTALTFHYETQPLPTWIGWWAHQLPMGCQKASCTVMFAVELGAPFFYFGPRRLRLWAAGLTAGLEALIALTGNYTFFNLLTITLCIPLLDDAWLRSAARKLRLASRSGPGEEIMTSPAGGEGPSKRSPTVEGDPGTNPDLDREGKGWQGLVPLRCWAGRIAAVFILLITTVQMAYNCRVRLPWPEWVLSLTAASSSLRSWNSYGLFRVMTRPRYEIIVEGSQDGETWLPYVFKYKPGPLGRRPGFVEPHQPRLDWQMWFEALRPAGAGVSPWFGQFCLRLMEGSPTVLDLVQENPFPDTPPRYLRARRFEYHFTTPAEKRLTGNWWKREPKGLVLPPVSRKGP